MTRSTEIPRPTARLSSRLAFGLLVAAIVPRTAHATWSIILIDTESKEIAVGSATCLTSFDLEFGLPIVLVDIGAGAAQSAIDSNATNRRRIRDQLLLGADPAQILQILAANDASHQTRQYGIVDVLGRAVTFTGTGAGAHASGVTGRIGSMVYAIQGNVLTGAPVVLQAEQAVRNTPGDLPEKLMAGMEAARAMGGDGRCSCSQASPTSCGAPPASFAKSAHIGFMFDTRTGDVDGPCAANTGCAAGSYYMNFNFANQMQSSPDPVVQLQQAFDAWRAGLVGRPDAVHSAVSFEPVNLAAEAGAMSTMVITVRDWQGQAVDGAALSVTVAHAAGSDQRSILPVDPPTHVGGGVFHLPLTSTGVAGVDRFRVTIDDGVRPVVLIPMPELHVCGAIDQEFIDCNANLFPDFCEMVDCNANGRLDSCDIAHGASRDENANARPDDCEPATLFVDAAAAGANNGVSWANAFADLQDALAVASSSVGRVREVRVAQGVYKPDLGTGDRTKTFRLSNGLALRGGYAGTLGDQPDARNPHLFATILTGDLSGDDGVDFTNYGENSYHVVTGSGTDATALIEGFVIRAGNASLTNSTTDRAGGGLVIVAGSPTVRVCRFVDNSAISYGGAVANDAGHGLFEDCTFSLNRTQGVHGGAMFNNNGSDPRVVRCTFDSNASAVGGGAVFNWNQSHATFDGCSFLFNSAIADGGAILNWSTTRPTIRRCLFRGNLAAGRGGAVMNNSSSQPTIESSVFFGNNTIGPAPGSDGGAIYNSATSSMFLKNSTIAGNNAAALGGGVVISGANHPPIVGTILWDNREPGNQGQSAQIRGTPASVDWSIVQGWDGSLAGQGTTAADPLFEDFVLGRLRPTPPSPAINNGDPALAEAFAITDIANWPRVQCGGRDIGAYESLPGDVNCDGMVGPTDIAQLDECVLGPADSPADCEAFDWQADGQIGLSDFAALQKAYNP